MFITLSYEEAQDRTQSADTKCYAPAFIVYKTNSGICGLCVEVVEIHLARTK